MNYIGSKLKLSSWIKDEIMDTVGRNLSDKVFCDLFAGTGIIGRTFKADVKKVIANDIESYSYVLNRNYIGNHLNIDGLTTLIEELNNVKPRNGFIYQNYCLGGGSGRLYFSDENGQKIDAIRIKISAWREKNHISEDIYYFLLASLLESADAVANTASVYGAFLKKLKSTALKPLTIKPAYFEINHQEHEVYQQDANALITQISGDILYLDPPYNARQYGANYHLLNTICLYDNFIPKGKTGLREYQRSQYCSKSEVARSFDELISKADFKYIFVSYNNEGLMTTHEIQQILSKYGKYDLAQKQYQRFKADKTESRNHRTQSTFEYLHILEKYDVSIA
ncbi:adenine-specific DNA-methyltransferase [Nicoletella semolina]|uniref:site-specific DNA-methyltransferase (adenine-specific) n=1 Tax=Nicoletella semolina TaxID=271160 RepID=A0A4V2SKA9_9PAST|nr:DNA adenine methylase [Nicoletella semolina]MDH2924217.1 modification methylase [Nicoletella semolina]TCP18886.1 adenine-specific DNA-methyltransferase [Nicoletella semolina]